MHTSRKPQCFNELQNRTNWSCSDRTFTISPIFRAKRIPAETALQVKTEMCASTRASPWGRARSKQSSGPTGQRFIREGVGPLALSTFAATRPSRPAWRTQCMGCNADSPSHPACCSRRGALSNGDRFARGRVSPRRESAFFRSQSLQQFPSLVDTLHHALQLREFARLGHSFLAHVCGTTLLVVICGCGTMFFVLICNAERRATFSVRQG